jgi:anti-sigma B factor antagonist
MSEFVTVDEGRFAISRFGSVISVVGELDVSSVDALKAIVGDGDTDLVVDLGAVTFIDSAGIVALLSAQETARTSGRRFVVDEPSPFVERVLENAGAATLFEVTTSRRRSPSGRGEGNGWSRPAIAVLPSI